MFGSVAVYSIGLDRILDEVGLLCGKDKNDWDRVEECNKDTNQLQ